jgi:hypothetical protein
VPRVVTDVPEDLRGRCIPSALPARDFTVELTTAEPWPGGEVAGRVVRRGDRHDPRPFTVTLAIRAAWLEVSPERVGQQRFNLATPFTYRTRRMPIWLERTVLEQSVTVAGLAAGNWVAFRFQLAEDAPRAFEATFAAVRYEVIARRRRAVGNAAASVPLLVLAERDEPVIRIETTPLGRWRLLEWRAAGETDTVAGPVSVQYSPRKSEEMPLPGEDREAESLRRVHRPAWPA